MTDPWQTANAEVISLMEKGRLEEALQAARQVVELCRREPPDPSRLAVSLNNLGELCHQSGLLEEGEETFLESLALAGVAYGAESLESAETLTNLAELHLTGRHYDQAVSCLEQVAAIHRRPEGNPLEYARVLSLLAMILQGQGKTDQARARLEMGVSLIEEHGGESAPHLVPFLRGLADLDLRAGENDAAETTLRRALQILDQEGESGQPDLGGVIALLAEVHLAKGAVAVAETFFGQAMAIFADSLGGNHPETAALAERLAGLCAATGRMERAETLFRQVLQSYGESLGENHPATARAGNDLAELYLNTSRPELAMPLLEGALAARRKHFSNDHPAVAQTLNNLGVAHSLQGQTS
ncbi:MAG: tetratricopeptide repeat protein, partial [Desulforhopalus sp.]|nr:tetratricopeptide repeat protein [Desulforhopalus sp.]